MLAALLIALVIVVVAGVTAVMSTGASLASDPAALAKVGLPFGGGRIVTVSVVTGPNSRPIPVEVRDNRIWPRGTIPAGARVSIEAVVKRPGWIAWLAGSRDRVRLSLKTPAASPRQNYYTITQGAPLRVSFEEPVATISYGPTAAQLRRHVLGAPTDQVTLPRSGAAGTLWVAVTPRTWERSSPSAISWFPTGAATAAVASPAPGSPIGPDTPIALTFSKPVSSALGNNRPPVSPVTSGSWHQASSHTIVFRPSGYGYGLGATVKIGLPAGVRLVGGHATSAAEDGVWTVPPGSTLRLQQLLATLGYLPLSFQPGTTVAPTAQSQEAAAIHPPPGTFSWRYSDLPSALRQFWAPGASGVMTRGAVMAFENDHGLAPDGVAGAQVWRALIGAAATGHASGFGYTFVTVNRESSPQSLTIWHNGRTILTTDVNTGISSAPTVPGTFPVFEHIRVGTMSGTNPDGSHYSDPGIQFISYFNGGDALHAFDRAQFGFPQSLGCVEMALGPAGQVWPYTPVGSLVHVV